MPYFGVSGTNAALNRTLNFYMIKNKELFKLGVVNLKDINSL